MIHNKRIWIAGLLASSLPFSSFASDKNDEGEILVVTAELEDANVLELPNSVTVISEEMIEKRSSHQLTDLLNFAPNVNSAPVPSKN